MARRWLLTCQQAARPIRWMASNMPIGWPRMVYDGRGDYAASGQPLLCRDGTRGKVMTRIQESTAR